MRREKSEKKFTNYMVRKAIIKKKLFHLIILIVIFSSLVLGGISLWIFKPISINNLNFISNKLFNPAANNNYLILLNELAKDQIGISYLNYLDNETVEASLSSGVKVIFSLKKEPINLVTSLQLILSRFRIEGRKVNKIDLRFKNPVVE